MSEVAAQRYRVELVARERSGPARAWAWTRAVVASALDGFVPYPSAGEVVVRRTTSSVPSLRIRVDVHDAGGVLAKVQDDLDRLDVETFEREWGL